MMDDLEYILEDYNVYKIIESAVDGYHYNPNGDVTKPFNVRSDYFVIGNGGIVSIDEETLADYIENELNIDKEDFMDWCKEQGYID